MNQSQMQPVSLQISAKTLILAVVAVMAVIPATIFLTIGVIAPRIAHADNQQTANANPSYQLPAGYVVAPAGSCPVAGGTAAAGSGAVVPVAWAAMLPASYTSTINQTNTETNTNTNTTNTRTVVTTNTTTDSNNVTGDTASNNGNGSFNGNGSGNTSDSNNTNTATVVTTTTTDSNNTINSNNDNSAVDTHNSANNLVHVDDSLGTVVLTDIN